MAKKTKPKKSGKGGGEKATGKDMEGKASDVMSGRKKATVADSKAMAASLVAQSKK